MKLETLRDSAVMQPIAQTFVTVAMDKSKLALVSANATLKQELKTSLLLNHSKRESV